MTLFTKKTINSEFEKIEVPENKLDYALTKAIEKGNLGSKKKLSNRIFKPVSLAISLTLTLFLALLFTNSSIADVIKNLPILESVFMNKGDKGLETVYEQEKIQVINETEKSEDIQLRLTEVYYDDIRFAVGYEMTLLNENITFEEAGGIIFENTTYVNNKEIQMGSSTSLSDGNFPVLKGVLDFEPNKEKLGETFDFKIKFGGSDLLKEELTFEFPVYYVKGTELSDVTKVTKDENGKIDISDVIQTPSGVGMNANLFYPLTDKGNESSVEYFISSEKGLWYESLKKHTIIESDEYFEERFGKFQDKSRVEFRPVDKGKFSIIPVIVHDGWETAKHPIEEGTRIETNTGSFTVTNMEILERGVQLEIQVDEASSFLSFENMWLSNAHGPIERLGRISRIEDNKYSIHVQSWNNEKMDNLAIEVIPVDPLEELQIEYK